MISIILPVYNVAPYLRQCLDSVCGQTYRDIEIIAVNDGSTDQSLEILKEYAAKDDRIILIDQKNAGLSAARNVGLERASGSYILFLDSDDWIDLNTCELAYETIRRDASQVVIWNYYREYVNASRKTLLLDQMPETLCGSAAKRFHRRMVGPVGDELKKPELLDSLTTAWGKLYEKDFIADARFVDTKMISSEDVLFNIEVFSRADRISYLPDILSHYRKSNQTSLTTGYSEQILIRWMELTRRIRACLDAHGATDDYYQALTHRICCSLIGLGFRLMFDRPLTRKERMKELRRLLETDYYHDNLVRMDRSPLSAHWKLFFWAARNDHPHLLALLYYAMNILRRVH